MKNLTVAELIRILQDLPQDAEVEIGMNQEYQYAITAEDVTVQSFDFHNGGTPYVFIGD